MNFSSFRIDEDSPLWQLGPQDLPKAKFEIILILEVAVVDLMLFGDIVSFSMLLLSCSFLMSCFCIDVLVVVVCSCFLFLSALLSCHVVFC